MQRGRFIEGGAAMKFEERALTCEACGVAFVVDWLAAPGAEVKTRELRVGCPACDGHGHTRIPGNAVVFMPRRAESPSVLGACMEAAVKARPARGRVS
jgi:hypothetical protein